MIKDVGLL